MRKIASSNKVPLLKISDFISVTAARRGSVNKGSGGDTGTGCSTGAGLLEEVSAFHVVVSFYLIN
ncbi:MAG: hypothetical protein P8Z75_04545 [Gammaproteobacteria bacterium]